MTETLGIGGTESHLIRVLGPLASRSWDTTVYCICERGVRADQLEATGVKVVAAPWPAKQPSHRPRNPARILLAANRLFWLMRRLRPQIVHFYLPGPYLVGAPLAIAAGAPVKIMSRRSLATYRQRRPLLSRIEPNLHRYMDAVIGNSRAVVGELTAEGIPSEKIRLIYNGIETAVARLERGAARQALGITQEALIGVIVANLISYKGHKDLIEGLGRVAAELPTGWRLLCAGRDEGLRAKLETLAEALGIKENIMFLGEREDVPTLLSVQITPEKPHKASKPDKKHRGKRYSFTNQQMDLHTDSTFDTRPHELVAMQFVRVDANGGDSLMAPVESVLAELDDGVKQSLAEPNFPFGPGVFPILWQQHGAPNIRYYRSQIDFACENGGHINERSLKALNSLDAVLRRADTVFHFHAEAGETVYMHNTKVLHGRTSFSECSDRLMYRFRIHAQNLG